VIWYFVFFFISGFCAVLYELVWLRLAMAQFGVTTAMVSIVLSVFMAGMGLGSWASGRWLRGHAEIRALRLYARIELLIGVSGIAVPYELLWGRRVLTNFGVSSSVAYYVVAGLWAAATLIPWCALMGATLPVAMRAIAQMFPGESARSFSYLYMANVAGAVVGTEVPLALIELYGFHATLKAGVVCNLLIAVSATLLARQPLRNGGESASLSVAANDVTSGGDELLRLLFLTGLTSMGMEVVWVRQFTPYLGTVVYAFASILASYLLATFVGSRVYRWWGTRHTEENPLMWTLLALAALIPLVTSSPFFPIEKGKRLMLGVMPFTGLLGFITPMLVDRYSRGNPTKAGSAYAINVVGCIVGPLLAGFVLLPWVSERWALVALTVPWLIVSLRAWLRSSTTGLKKFVAVSEMLLLTVAMILLGRGYQDAYPDSLRLRDSTATVIAAGSGMQKQLLVNGYGMTTLQPATKMMAHLPLAFLDRAPQDTLDICFGMGTTFRSLLTWNVHTTAVELVPSVPQAFGYFHSDGSTLLKSPLARVVIDDGRRYLERTSEQFDLITIDPPPPVEAAGSSLLYSEEFYGLAKRRLRPGGIVAQWLPNGDPPVLSAVAHALKDSFPYVRVFQVREDWGYHFFASDHPLPQRNAEELVKRMPERAVADLTEWYEPPSRVAGVSAIDNLLKHETTLDEMIAKSPATPALRDDRPINEYYRLRRRRQRRRM
jgi:spermidine synthase